jgi:two-component system LytT family sensor kinase
MRLVLENSMHPLVPLQQDLQALELYIELEVIRCNHWFTYTLDVDDDLLEDGYKIPPLLLQPYIENAIVHGLRHKEKQGGKLFVGIKRESGHVVISIEDNGIGRMNSIRMNNENQRPREHLGMEVTGRRIALLQKMTENKVEFTIEDIQPSSDTGTRVRIILPEQFGFESNTLN